MYDTVMILYVICQLVCVIDSWAHTSFVHSILSLKLGVTLHENICSMIQKLGRTNCHSLNYNMVQCTIMWRYDVTTNKNCSDKCANSDDKTYKEPCTRLQHKRKQLQQHLICIWQKHLSINHIYISSTHTC